MTTEPASQRLTLEQYREHHPGQQLRRLALPHHGDITILGVYLPEREHNTGTIRHYNRAVWAQVCHCERAHQRRVLIWEGSDLAHTLRLEYVDREWSACSYITENDHKHALPGLLETAFDSPEQCCDWYVKQRFGLEAPQKPVTAPERQPVEHPEYDPAIEMV